MQMRTLMLTAVVGLMLGLTTMARAEDKPKDKPEKKPAAALMGEIVSVDDASVVVKGKDGTEVTVAVDANTQVKIDGKEATVADLKPGMMVAVSNLDGPAKQIKVRTGKPQDGAKKKKKDDGGTKKDNGDGEGDHNDAGE